MKDNFSKALARVLVYEGGKSNNPRDPGGRTNKGITQITFNAYLREKNIPTADVYSITDQEVAEIYKIKFWDVMKCDDIPSGLDLSIMDAGVNSGPGQSGKWLQRALGDSFPGPIDGIIGSKTLQAVDDHGDVEGLIKGVCSRRLAMLRALRTWPTFGAGWARRVANVQRTALSWMNSVPAPVAIPNVGGKALPSNIKPPLLGQGVAHSITVVAGAGAAASEAASQLQPVQENFPHWHWLTYLISFLTIGSVAGGGVAKIQAMNTASAADGTKLADVPEDTNPTE